MRPVSAWGFGWMIGGLLMAAAFFMLELRRSEAIAAILSVGAAVAAFGFPTLVATRRQNSRRPFVQALVWATIFAAAAIVLSHHYLAETGLASPGELNINTTETMRAREASFRRWGVEPEVVSSWIFTLTVAVAACFSSGVLSALIAIGWGFRPLIRAIAFGLVTTVAILAGIAVLPLGTYLGAILMSAGELLAPLRLLTVPIAFVSVALLTGSAAGAAIESARGALLLEPGTRGSTPRGEDICMQDR